MAEETAPKSQLRPRHGLWTCFWFNIAAVLGPRWIAAARTTAHRPLAFGCWPPCSFFLPTALIIIELSTRYPAEGGLYVWSKEAFGDFHGFVAGWRTGFIPSFIFPAC